jgi:hypothetical protein
VTRLGIKGGLTGGPARERERERGEADGGSRQLTGKRVMGDVDRVCESGPIGKE